MGRFEHGVPGVRLGMIALLVAAGCSGDPAAPAQPGVFPLQPGVWHLHAVGGAAMPAVVSTRTLPGGHRAELVADSASFTIRPDGRFTFRSWTTEYYPSGSSASTPWSEEGSWTRSAAGYTFTSDGGEHRGVIADSIQSPQALSLELRLAPGLEVRTALLRPTVPVTMPSGTWRAEAVAGRPVPATVYVFTGVIEDGREISSHFILDSAALELRPTGRYVHRIWYTEWEGEVNGPPQRIRIRWYHGDFGTWRAVGDQVSTESGWVQNHRMSGSFDGATRRIVLAHGLVPGDDTVSVHYAPSQARSSAAVQRREEP